MGHAIVTGAWALLLLSCSPKGGGGAAIASLPAPPVTPRPADVTAEGYVPAPMPRGTVVLTDAFGGRHAVEVEVAASEPARTRGMMWRTSLAEGKGMLFVFPHESVQSFWMRNTLIPLDMIFITADGRIAGIVERAAPRSLISRRVSTASQYVLEVPGGWSEKVGLRPGGKVSLERLPRLDVR